MSVEIWLQRLGALRVDGLLIHTCREVVADLLFNRRPGRFRRAGFEDITKNLLIPFMQLIEATPGCLVRRDGVIGQPASARVLVKVGTRVGFGVQGFRVKALLRHKVKAAQGEDGGKSKDKHKTGLWTKTTTKCNVHSDGGCKVHICTVAVRGSVTRWDRDASRCPSADLP